MIERQEVANPIPIPRYVGIVKIPFLHGDKESMIERVRENTKFMHGPYKDSIIDVDNITITIEEV